MITRRIGIILCLLLPILARAQANEEASALLAGAVTRILSTLNPPAGSNAAIFTSTIKVNKAEGFLKAASGRQLNVAFQYPDHLKLDGEIEGRSLSLGRDGQEVWMYAPEKKFAVLGSPDVPMFKGEPGSRDGRRMGPLRIPMADHLVMLPMLSDAQLAPDELIGTTRCKVIKASPKPESVSAFNLAKFNLKIHIRESDRLPVRIAYDDPKGNLLEVELVNATITETATPDTWKLKVAPGHHVERAARSHLTRFFEVASSRLLKGNKIPTLGPAKGDRKVLAREGKGRLEQIDGTRVLFVKGTPEEMGQQHGALLRKEVRDLTEQILYGVGVGSSFEKGRWFFGEIEEAVQRIKPFTDERYFREIDSLARASGMSVQEARLANFFPELFHCSGFSLFGDATQGGRMYHGRILDYLRGMGLEQNAVVMVMQPDEGNAWVNISYAGFVGSVTAMNDKHISIGEMGGRGEGNWDGKPMAQLVREVMEKANTLDEAVEIMRKGPRTCEYYYVISDAKTKSAVGIAATPKKFEVIRPGQAHSQLPHAIKDAVLMSAGDRYEELAKRVKSSYGKLDVEGAKDLMKRPVCMTSNIHSVLFEPESLDFWVANADSQNPAAHTRYTQYNLAQLLEPERGQ